MPEILYPYAFDEWNKLVFIKDASQSQYHCVECGCEMIPRQGEINAWHFAHKSNNPSCSGESALHKIAKMVLSDKFNSGCLPAMCVVCPFCGQSYFKVANQEWVLQNELLWHGIRPDLSFWSDNKLVFVIEIVVSHSLEKVTANTYLANEIPVFIWNPTWEIISKYIEVLSGSMLDYKSHMECHDYSTIRHVCFYTGKRSPVWMKTEHCRPCHFYKDGHCNTQGGKLLRKRMESENAHI